MYSTPNFYYPQQFAHGGSVKHGLASAAEQLRRKGRGGDTILAHINPQEAGILKLLGGSGGINPHTGLPEFLGWKDLNPVKIVHDVASGAGDLVSKAGSAIDDAIFQPVLGAANSIAEALGPIGAVAAAYFGGPLGAAIYGGFAAPGDKFSLKGAATTGALAYGGEQLLGGMGGGTNASFDYAGEFGADPFGVGDAVSSGTPVAPSADVIQNIPATVPPSGIGGISGVSAAGPTASAGLPSIKETYDLNQILGVGNAPDVMPVSDVTTVGGSGGPAPTGPTQFFPSADVATVDLTAPAQTGGISTVPELPARSAWDIATDFGSATADTAKGIATSAKDIAKAAAPYAQAASLGMTGYGMYEAKKEQEKFKKEAERTQQAQAAKKASDIAFAQDVMSQYPMRYERPTETDVRSWFAAGGGAVPPHDSEYGNDNAVATGGLMSLAGGGMPPRFLSGGGDGMSDSIKANIEGRQEARLADGEFVVPADVVSGLGNGSSKAGAQKLYAMMDRVRQARTGKKSQAPAINARRLMPA